MMQRVLANGFIFVPATDKKNRVLNVEKLPASPKAKCEMFEAPWAGLVKNFVLGSDITSNLQKVSSTAWDIKKQKMHKHKAGKCKLKKIHSPKKWTEAPLVKEPLLMSESCPMTDTEVQIRASAQLIYRNLDAFQGKISCILHNEADKKAKVDKLDLGDVLEVSQVGAYSGNYLITGIKNDFIAGVGWRVTLTLGLPLNYTLFSDWLKAPPVPNLIGQVVAWKDDPELLERIPVWLPEITDKKTEVVWARLGTPFASKYEGIHFQPNIEDEVIVGFSGGVSNYPFIIGSTHNPINKPPIPYVDPIEERGILFDPKIKGEGEYQDTFLSWNKTEKLVRLQGGPKKKASINLDDEKGVVLAFDVKSIVSIDDKEITLKHHEKSSIKVTKLIDMNTEGELKVTAKNGVAITAKVDITGKTEIKK
jgi:hypothetical protein